MDMPGAVTAPSCLASPLQPSLSHELSRRYLPEEVRPNRMPPLSRSSPRTAANSRPLNLRPSQRAFAMDPEKHPSFSSGTSRHEDKHLRTQKSLPWRATMPAWMPIYDAELTHQPSGTQSPGGRKSFRAYGSARLANEIKDLCLHDSDSSSSSAGQLAISDGFTSTPVLSTVSTVASKVCTDPAASLGCPRPSTPLVSPEPSNCPAMIERDILTDPVAAAAPNPFARTAHIEEHACHPELDSSGSLSHLFHDGRSSRPTAPASFLEASSSRPSPTASDPFARQAYLAEHPPSRDGVEVSPEASHQQRSPARYPDTLPSPFDRIGLQPEVEACAHGERSHPALHDGRSVCRAPQIKRTAEADFLPDLAPVHALLGLKGPSVSVPGGGRGGGSGATSGPSEFPLARGCPDSCGTNDEDASGGGITGAKSKLPKLLLRAQSQNTTLAGSSPHQHASDHCSHQFAGAAGGFRSSSLPQPPAVSTQFLADSSPTAVLDHSFRTSRDASDSCDRPLGVRRQCWTVDVSD